MTRFYYSLHLRRFFSVLLVLFLSLSMSCHLVHASVDIGNGVSYDSWYQDPTNNQWVVMSEAGGAITNYPNREYRIRIRFYLPATYATNAPVDINFTLNTQASYVDNITLTTIDVNGQQSTQSQCSYNSLVASANSSLTKHYFGIYGFRCTTQAWVTLSFSYYSAAATHPTDIGKGLIVCGVPNFSIVDSSTDNVIYEFKDSVHNDFMDLIEQESVNTNNIINNQNSNTNSIINNNNANTDEIVTAINDSNDDLMDLIDGHNGGGGGHIFGKMDEQTSLLDDISNGIFDVFTSVGDLIGDFGDFVFSLPGILWDAITDALQWLFVPDLDDLQDYIEESIEDFREQTPLLASLLSVFDTIISNFNTGTVAEGFNIPSFTIPLPQNTQWTFDAIAVPLFPSGLNSLLIPTRNFLAIVTSILLIRFVFFKLFSALGFSGRDNPSDIEDGE